MAPGYPSKPHGMTKWNFSPLLTHPAKKTKSFLPKPTSGLAVCRRCARSWLGLLIFFHHGCLAYPLDEASHSQCSSVSPTSCLSYYSTCDIPAILSLFWNRLTLTLLNCLTWKQVLICHHWMLHKPHSKDFSVDKIMNSKNLIAPRLRTLSALAEDPGSVPSTHRVVHNCLKYQF